MTDEKSEKRLPKEEAPEVPERTDVVVRGGASRCPHCHDNVHAEDDAWAACRGCLARHHVACWGEGGACSACGEKRFVSSVPARKAPARSSTSSVAGVAIALGIGCVSLLVGLVVTTRGSQRNERDLNRLMFENDHLEKQLAAAKTILRESDKTVSPMAGLVKRTFTLTEARELHYVPLGGTSATRVVKSGTADEFALLIAQHVLEGDHLTRPEAALALFDKVEPVMAQDPDRTIDLAKIRAALKVLRP